jgi:hypothetical protein
MLLEAMADDVEQHGATLAVVVLSNPLQVHPDAAVNTEACRKLGVDDLFYPDRRIEAACQRLGLPCLTLAPVLRDRAATSGTYFHGFGENLGTGHWNSEGHRVAGILIAEWLRPVIAELLFSEHGSSNPIPQ